jgi:hypothetical protein
MTVGQCTVMKLSASGKSSGECALDCAFTGKYESGPEGTGELPYSGIPQCMTRCMTRPYPLDPNDGGVLTFFSAGSPSAA